MIVAYLLDEGCLILDSYKELLDVSRRLVVCSQCRFFTRAVVPWDYLAKA
jgi:hypothetical protein